ncbi:MAG: type II toxin-antitoxin system VapC family toxin [Acidobacteria bacterium]|nr:type II toxin-antitoxin system VapC family toxin [Acidobacteriota bacterium]
MNLYAESSAVLAWLLGERSGAAIRRHLRNAGIVLASDLTLVECDRVILRAVTLKEITENKAASCRNRLNKAAAYWYILRLSGDIVLRARQSFPREPIRTLDALHVACAIAGRLAVPNLRILSLDERIRASASELGFPLLPK